MTASTRFTPSPFPLLALAALVAVAGSSAFAVPTTTIWTSTSDTNFSTGANWDAGAPANDLTSHIVRFSTAGLASPVLATSQSVAGLSFTTATRLSATNGAVLAVGGSNISVANSAGGVVISTALAGTAGLTKSGGAALTLSGANTYSGGTNLAALGTINLAHASALGSGAFTFSGSTGTLDNTSGAALTLSNNNALSFTGTNLVFTGTNNLDFGAGAVTLGTSTKTFTVNANTLTLGGAVGGTIGLGLRKLGTGTLVLNGATSFVGTLTVSGGTLTLAGTSTRTGQNIVNTGATLNINHASALGTGILAFNTNPRIDNTSGAAIALTTDNTQIWNSDFTFLGTNSLNLGTGAVTTNGFHKVTVNGSTLTVGGAIRDSLGYGLTKAGAGTLVLGGANVYTGPTVVNAGTLLVTGSLSEESTVTVNSGATLGGSGTVNGPTTLASGATLAPGNSPGKLTFGSDLTLAAGSTTVFQIDGTGRGTTFDAIDLTTGTLAYGGAFDLVFGTTLASGTTLDLFSLSGSGSNGSFSSILASGSYTGLFTNNDGLWTLVAGAQTLTFSQATGDLSVSGSAIPEPSTYAMLAGACALGFAAWRRRTLASA